MSHTTSAVIKQKRANFLLMALLGIGSVFTSSCEIEIGSGYEYEPVVSASLQPYIDRFVGEASIRGLDVEYSASQVEAHIGEIDETNVIGQCSWSSHHPHSITIEEDYWRTANELQREFVVFHELGHCVLGKDHNDNQDINGNCASIMTSGTSGCRVLYTSGNRNKLLDELFSN